jgi:hypothetical protein
MSKVLVPPIVIPRFLNEEIPASFYPATQQNILIIINDKNDKKEKEKDMDADFSSKPPLVREFHCSRCGGSARRSIRTGPTIRFYCDPHYNSLNK